MFACFVAGANMQTYVGSTPAHAVVRDFIQISAIDSIDFIRWKLEFVSDIFKVQCRYGLAKAGTPGFSNERSVAFEGQLTKLKNNYYLKHKGKVISILEVNANVLHFLDRTNNMLPGNGGYSYALNSTQTVQVDGVNIRSAQTSIKSPLIFEGRTPCSDLPSLLGLKKSEACNKMKWYFIFYPDSITGHLPTFLWAAWAIKRKRWQEAGGKL